MPYIVSRPAFVMPLAMEELNEAEIIATEKIQQQYFVCRKRRDIALIEYPSLSLIVSKELGKRQIPYIGIVV